MMRQQLLSISNPEALSFTNFFINKKNSAVIDYLKRFVHQTSEKIVYLFGNPGSGLTHLQHACSELNQFQENYYVSFKNNEKNFEFIVNELVEKVEDAKKTNINLLILLDDIDFISENSLLEKTVFNLFNDIQYAQQNNMKLIIAGHVLPVHFVAALPDLKSRLQSLLVLNITELSDREKIQALQMRACLRGFTLPEEVGQYLLNHFPRDLHYLFQSLDKLDLLSLEEKRKLSIPFVKKVL